MVITPVKAAGNLDSNPDIISIKGKPGKVK
jgi:hypothetical protein